MAGKHGFAVVGFTQHRKLAPFGHPDWEVHGMNALHKDMPLDKWPFTGWWQPHPREILLKNGHQDHIEWLKQCPLPVYVLDANEWPDVPNPITIPRKEIEALWHHGKYHTSSVSWMVGWAILQKFREIHVYGIDMASDCLAPDTKVLTADLRWVRAGDVQVGDELIGFDENNGSQTEGPQAFRQWRVSKVLGRSIANRPSYRVHLEDGTSIVASTGHKWLTYAEHETRWKTTHELVTPQHRRPTRLMKVLNVWPEDGSREAGYLASAFDGEGSLAQQPHSDCNGHTLTLGFSQKNNAMADRVRLYLRQKGFEWGEYSGTCGTVKYQLHGGRPEVMRFLGQMRPARLLDKFDPSILGGIKRQAAVAVTRIERLGEIETIGFTTTTRTLIAEGFATHNSEYRYQRPACEAWLGYAEGLGIKTYTPVESDLFSTVAQYGFGEQSTFRKYLHGKVQAYMERKAQIEQNLAEIRMQKRNIDEDFDTKERRLLHELHKFEGMLMQVSDLLQNVTVPEAGGGTLTEADGGAPFGLERRSLPTGEDMIVAVQGDGAQNRIKESVDG